MKAIQVKRSIHIEMADVREDVMAGPLGYLSPRGNSMMELVVYGLQRSYDYFTKGLRDPHVHNLPVIRRSDDNGRTWREVGTWTNYSPIMGRLRLCYFGLNYIYNPKAGTLLRLFGTQEDIEGTCAWDRGSPAMMTRLVWSQLSRDDGLSWSEPEQVIMQGAEFNALDWAPGMRYGMNGAYIECSRPLWLDQERFMLPVNAIGEPATLMRLRSACLIGRWRTDDSGVDWTMSAFATVLRPYSWQGGGEPSAAILPDGRWLMTMRVSVGVDETFPSGKFYVVSADQGKTWSEPQALYYDDGAQVLCPASLARIFVSSKNGRLYFIANMLAKPTKQNGPRWPLQIAELDLNTFRVKRATVTVIEPQPDTTGTAETVEFSNWGDYEDRETKNWVMFMTFQSVGPRNEQCTVPPHAFRYDIVLPE